MPDLKGTYYIPVLQQLHEALRPKTYMEIGVLAGQSLALARCPAIAVDPEFKISPEYAGQVLMKPEVHFYQMGSDDFFARVRPSDVFDAPIDMAFLDGMHRCEYLLRDFINTERHCKKNSIIALHDCLPVEPGIATRLEDDKQSVAPQRRGWWTGDVWRTSLLLRRFRPDLSLTVLDCHPTGLILVTNLNPASNSLADNYACLVREMLSWDLTDIGIAALFTEMQIEPASVLQTHEGITRRFWL